MVERQPWLDGTGTYPVEVIGSSTPAPAPPPLR